MNKTTLSQAVMAYRQKQVRHWLIISGATLGGLVSLCGFITVAQIKKYHTVTHEYALLKSTISTLQKQWGTQQKLSQKIKLLKKERTFFSEHDVGKYLTLISQTIPDLTYLREIELNPQVVVLKGFSPNEGEVGHFLETLTQNLEKKITQASQAEPAGMHFEIRVDLSK